MQALFLKDECLNTITGKEAQDIGPLISAFIYFILPMNF